MALDKVVDSAVLDAEMTSVANAIRAKTGNTDTLAWPNGFLAAIAEITGGGGAGLAYDMGEFVLDADTKYLDPSLPHNLGEIPEFILVWTDDFAGLSKENPAAQQYNLGYVWLKNLTGMLQGLTTAATGDSLTINFNLLSGDYRIQLIAPNSAVYLVKKQPTAEYFGLNQIGSKHYWRAGVTYKYFVSKAWWNIGGAANAE